jgi:hypothetical protein
MIFFFTNIWFVLRMNETLRCEFCLKIFSCRKTLVKHLKTAMFCLLRRQNNNIITLCKCGERFDDQVKLSTHQVTCILFKNSQIDSLRLIEKEMQTLKDMLSEMTCKQPGDDAISCFCSTEKEEEPADETGVNKECDPASSVCTDAESSDANQLRRPPRSPRSLTRERYEVVDENRVVLKDSVLILNSINIECRSNDGKINATQLCQAGGKKYNDWYRLKTTEEFLNELSASAGIPAAELLTYENHGSSDRATWVHPQVAINIAQWVSAKFDVQVSKWVYELAVTGQVVMGSEKSTEELDNTWRTRIEAVESRLQAKAIKVKQVKERLLIAENEIEQLRDQQELLRQQAFKECEKAYIDYCNKASQPMFENSMNTPAVYLAVFKEQSDLGDYRLRFKYGKTERPLMQRMKEHSRDFEDFLPIKSWLVQNSKEAETMVSNMLNKFGLRSTQSSSDGQKNHLEIFDTTEEMPLWNIIHEIDLALSNRQLVSNSNVLQVQLDSVNKEAVAAKEHLTEKIELIGNLHKKELASAQKELEANKEMFAMLKENYNDLKDSCKQIERQSSAPKTQN